MPIWEHIVKTFHVFQGNLKRNFLKEIILGIGLIIALVILIFSAAISDGLNQLLQSSVLAGIRTEEIKIVTTTKSTMSGEVERRALTQADIDALHAIPHVKTVYPFSQTTYPISVLFSLLTFNIQSEAVAEGISREMAAMYISEENRKKFMPNGWGQQPDGTVPVLLNGIVYKIMNRMLSSLQGGQIAKSYAEGFTFDMVLGRTIWKNQGIASASPERIKCVVVGFTHAKVCDLVAMPLSVVNAYKKKWEGTSSPSFEGCFIEVTEARLVDSVYQALQHHERVPVYTRDRLEAIPPTLMQRKQENAAWQFFFNSLPDATETLSDNALSDNVSPNQVLLFTLNTIAAQALTHLHYRIKTLEEAQSSPQLIFDESYEQMRANAKQLQAGLGVFSSLSMSLGFLILFVSGIAIFFAFLYLIIRREKEIGLYRFFGATRFKVVILFTLEGFVIALFCSGIGLVVTWIFFATFVPQLLSSMFQSYLGQFLSLFTPSGNSGEVFPLSTEFFHFPAIKAGVFAAITTGVGTLAALIPAFFTSYSDLLKRIHR